MSDQYTEVFYGGAAGGGKSYLGCLWQIYRRIHYPGTRGLIGRNDFVALRDTTLNTFFDLWNKYGAPTGHEGRYNGQDKTFTLSNGSEILFRHLAYEPSDPDFHRLGSLEITDGFVDELPELSEKAWDILMSRMRYKLDMLPIQQPKALACGNPSNNWVKHRFVFDKYNAPITPRPYQTFISANLSDNPNADFQRIYGAQLGKMSNYDQLRLLHGDWTATEQTGMEFYTSFKLNTHVRHSAPDYRYPLHLSFDQNVQPYLTLTIWQAIPKSGGMELVAINEICPEHPDNKTERLCELFLNRYEAELRASRQTVLLYGDASGNKRDTRGDTDYNIIKRVLRPLLSNISDRTNTFNPSVSRRRDFINEIFQGKFANIGIFVDPKCVNLINDLTGTKQDVNGGKLKSKERNPVTGQSFEKYGHTSDTMDYFICRLLKPEFDYFCGIK